MSKRAVIYTRVSTDDQATEGTSLEIQVERCRAYCVAQGWSVQEVYTDAGVSGAKASRPALDDMLAAVEGGSVAVVVVAKLDRLGRSLRHLAPLLGDLDDRGVALVSIAEAFDSSTVGGRLMRNMLGTMAEWERDTIRERTHSGRMRRVELGGWGGGDIAPYGYRVEGQGPAAALVPDEREAAMMLRAVALVLDHNMTTGQAAAALNAEGLTPRKAAVWTQMNLRNVLKRASLNGSWTYAKGRSHAVTISIPPLLDADRWQALQDHVQATSGGTRYNKAGTVYPLTGRLFGTCGHHFHGIGRADRKVTRYRCTFGRDTTNHEQCPEPTVRAGQVEDAVWAEVVALLADPTRLMAAAEEHAGLLEAAGGVERDAVVRADEQVANLERSLREAATTCLKAGLDASTMRGVVEGIQVDLDAARDHRTMLAAMRASTVAEVGRLEQVQRLALVASERLVNADSATRRRVLELLDVRVTIVSHGGGGGEVRAGRGGSQEPMRLRVEGNVAHGLLLASAESDWHLPVGASAPG